MTHPVSPHTSSPRPASIAVSSAAAGAFIALLGTWAVGSSAAADTQALASAAGTVGDLDVGNTSTGGSNLLNLDVLGEVGNLLGADVDAVVGNGGHDSPGLIDLDALALVKVLTGDTAPDNLAAWVTVVAINYVKQAWRRNAAQGRAYVRAVDWGDSTPDESDRAVDSIAVRDALGDLPERQRITVVLHYFEGLSVAQVAATLDVSTGTVKTQLSHGRHALAKNLKREAA